MFPSTPAVSVVIPTYNRGRFLLTTLETLLKNTYPHFDVIVVDQTPQYPKEVQSLLEAARRRYEYRHLKLAFPCLTFARNIGLEASTGEIVIFCDDDVIVGPDYVASHARCYGNPTIGAVAGRVISELDDLLSHPSGLIGRLNQDGTFIGNFHRDERVEVDFGMGCNMSFRRSALLRAGGFDERYVGGFYREEGDTFARIKKLGYKVVFEPATTLTHLATSDGGCRKDRHAPRMYSAFRNETLFFLNCMDHRLLLLFVYRLIRWMYATVRSHGYSAQDFVYFLAAFFGGVRAHYFEQPDRISATRRVRDLPSEPA